MFLNQPQFPSFYTWNDITGKHFATYTEKAVNLNNNVAEDAKKIIKSESKKSKA
jgi:hypothetical protein